jgi:hypothetical protein
MDNSIKCNNITNKYSNNKIINKLKKLIDIQEDNPKLIIETINIPNNININVIQDGYLMVGTKQRAVILFIKKILSKNKKIKTLLYAGAQNGFGAVACAYGAYKLGLKSHVFLSENDSSNNSKKYDTRQINTLHALNAEITICNSFKKLRELQYQLGFEDTINWKPKEEYYIPPMGFNDSEGLLVNILSKQIKKAMKDTLLSKIKNPRIWLVSGSGGILMSLHKALPKAHFIVLLSGGWKYKKVVIDWASKFNNIEILKNEDILDSKEKRTDRKLYYSSVEDYDDIIWPYIKKYAKTNDFIWNISSDDYLFL